MRIAIWILVLIALVWFLRSGRRNTQNRGDSHSAREQIPEDPSRLMVACNTCGIHLPRTEAVPGKLGHYCSVDHLQLAEC
jgi:uncharacterized protein